MATKAKRGKKQMRGLKAKAKRVSKPTPHRVSTRSGAILSRGSAKFSRALSRLADR